MATGYYDEPVEGLWDTLYPKQYDPDSVRVIIREEIDLALRSPDISRFLVDGTIPSTKLRIPTGEALPISAADGDIFVYQGTGFAWLFQYHRSSEYWNFIGGTASINEVTTTQSTSSTSYTDLSTSGPSVTCPFRGDYIIEHGALMYQTTGGIGRMSFSIGATAASDSDAVAEEQLTGVNLSRSQPLSVSAPAEILAKYRTTTNSVNAENRWMKLTPIRVRRT